VGQAWPEARATPLSLANSAISELTWAGRFDLWANENFSRKDADLIGGCTGTS
jgi:hypothetical protein